jgi:hypothetical protein
MKDEKELEAKDPTEKRRVFFGIQPSGEKIPLAEDRMTEEKVKDWLTHIGNQCNSENPHAVVKIGNTVFNPKKFAAITVKT